MVNLGSESERVKVGKDDTKGDIWACDHFICLSGYDVEWSPKIHTEMWSQTLNYSTDT